jgi:hypothetical protein
MAEPIKRDILDALLRINSRLERMESRLDAIVDRVKKLKANTLPPYEPLYEAPSDEPFCEE